MFVRTAMSLSRPYYRFRTWLVRAADRFGHWCDARTVDAYRFQPPWLQRAARGLCQWMGGLGHLAKLLPRLDAVKLDGPEWSAVYVGDPLLVKELEFTLFPGGAVRCPMPRVSAWALRRFVRQQSASVDLVVCGLPRSWPWFWRPTAPVAFTCPVFVNAVLDIRRPLADILRGARRASLRRQIRKAGEAGLTQRLSGSRSELERFYESMYRPHVEARHGERALLSSLEDHWREWIEPGGRLLLLERKEEPLAGVLVRIVGRVCFLGEEGLAQTPEADQVGYGLRALLKASAIEHARAEGATTFVRGRSLARCSDAVLASKLQWGPVVVPPERCLHPEWTFLSSQVREPLRGHLNQHGLIAFAAGRACVVSVGTPDRAQRRLASKVGYSLVVEPGRNSRVLGAGADEAEQEEGLRRLPGATLYYGARGRIVKAVDRLGHWCDRRTANAYAVRSPRLRGAAQRAIQALGRAAHVVKLLPRLDAVRLETADWSAVCVGDGSFEKELEYLLCPSGASAVRLPRVAAWSLRRYVRQQSLAADLVVCALPQAWPGIWRPRGPLVFRVPTFVEADLDLARPTAEILRGSPREALRRQIRKSEKAGLRPRLATARADVERFHRDMYLPHVEARHGARALISSLNEHLQQWIEPGGHLLLLEREGRPLAGVLVRVAGTTCLVGEEGVAQTPEAEAHRYGLRAALRVAVIEYARSNGATGMLMGRSLARGSNHVLTSKLQWGPALVPAKRCLQPEWTFVASGLTGPIRDHLNGHGLIALVSGVPSVVSIGEPTEVVLHHAAKVGSVLVVAPNQPGSMEAVGHGQAQAETGRPAPGARPAR